MSLTYRDIQFVKAMLVRGDRQHDIAAYFGVNAGRIAEVAKGNCEYPNAKPMEADKLPPPGPYITKFALASVIEALNEAISLIEDAEKEERMDDLKAALALARERLQQKLDSIREA